MTEYHKKNFRSINMIFPIKAVIFDADGVLLDSLSVWKELGKRYITDLGYQPVAEMDEILFPMSMEQGSGLAEKQVYSCVFRRKDRDGSEIPDP